MLIGFMQRICGLTDSVFLRGIVYAFLIDKGYATGDKDDNGLVLGDVEVEQEALKQLAKKCALVQKQTL
jgi:hypothetical protein